MLVEDFIRSNLFDDTVVSVVKSSTEKVELSRQSVIAEFKYFEGELVYTSLFKYLCLDDILKSKVIRVRNEKYLRTGLGRVILVI